jgi:hypothetical protein
MALVTLPFWAKTPVEKQITARSRKTFFIIIIFV